MSERGKSMLLITLVLLSLFLTHQLWFGIKALEEMSEDAYEPIFFEEPRPLEHVIAPRWILAHADLTPVLLQPGNPAYQSIWNEVSGLMQQVNGGEFRPAGEMAEQGLSLLTMSFSTPLPVGPGTPWFQDSVARELIGVTLNVEGDSLWIGLRAGEGAEMRLDIPANQGLALQELISSLPLDEAVPWLELNGAVLGEISDTEIVPAGLLYVPAVPVQAVDLVFSEEELDRELLLKTFFVDRSLVRVISERDGSLIFTDGEKGLRLSRGLAYSHPQLEQAQATQTYLSSLNSASRFLGYYGGWPSSLYLDRLEQQGKPGGLEESFYARWRSYYNGSPIFGGIGAEMIYNDSGMVEYKRRLVEILYPAGAPYPVLGYREAPPAALVVLHEKFGNAGTEPLILEEAVLGYAPDPASRSSRLVPAWLFRISGIDLLIHAKDLSWLEGVAP